MANGSLTPTASTGPTVVLVGAAHLDRIAASDAPFQAGCSNPGRLRERLGGAAFNAALALRAFGVEAYLVSACGGDEGGERIGAGLEQAGIGDGRIVWLDRRSATYTALLDTTGELIGGVADMDIYDRLSPRVLSRRHLKVRLDAADGLVIDANLSAPALLNLASDGLRRPVAAIAVSPAKAARLAEALPFLSMLFASRTEVSSLCGLAPDAADPDLVRALAAAGLRRAVVTDGPRPILAFEAGAAWRQAPPSVETVADVVGAGDTLAGATFAALLLNRSFRDALRVGLAAAALHVSVGLDAASTATVEEIASALPGPQAILV